MTAESKTDREIILGSVWSGSLEEKDYYQKLPGDLILIQPWSYLYSGTSSPTIFKMPLTQKIAIVLSGCIETRGIKFKLLQMVFVCGKIMFVKASPQITVGGDDDKVRYAGPIP